ncbi:MAG: helix-hairpin-helix domain-containing protein [Butyrivibrio sp.]|nr:helix-hairpin-helix domain-containing protein [Acetatifactor muris]MCM1560770.1 helix-hairpin-helix domain-containing protein [Butyrivibrio sp.]
MVKIKKIKAVLWGLALSGLLCGCGTQTDGLVLVGENGAAMYEDSGESAYGQMSLPAVGGERPEAGGASSAAGESGSEDPDGPAAASEELPQIYVYVCGAVNRPGVVVLPEGSRAEAALEAAGGFRQDAGRDYVNLAAKVQDGEKLYFPTEEETAELTTELWPESAGDGLININTADEEALCTLPGIGASRAGDILRYREENGPFESCEDIMKVPGIKDSVYGKIRDRIKIE